MVDWHFSMNLPVQAIALNLHWLWVRAPVDTLLQLDGLGNSQRSVAHYHEQAKSTSLSAPFCK